MSWLLATLVTGLITFTVTNIDDILLLVLFFSQVNGSFRRRHVIVGQYLGFTAIVAVSLVGFVGSLWIPQHWIGLLGILPIAIALKQIVAPKAEAMPDLTEWEQAHAASPLFSLFSRHTASVAAVTFANGGDNIGVYIPLFASSSLAQLSVLLVTFLGLTGLWCWLGLVVSRHPQVDRLLEKYSHRVVPVVLICLGLYILIENEAWLLFQR